MDNVAIRENLSLESIEYLEQEHEAQGENQELVKYLRTSALRFCKLGYLEQAKMIAKEANCLDEKIHENIVYRDEVNEVISRCNKLR